MVFLVGNFVYMKKRHPCGSNKWEILRIGADFKIKCCGCGHLVMIPRGKFEKNVKTIVKQEKNEISINTKDNTVLNKKVYIYFRLNNGCVNNKHIIKSVTAKTINFKNGEFIEVNVFHCVECDKYFINYESLQKYIDKGIYPALHFHLVNCDTQKFKETSALMLYGYNARDGFLSEKERQRILSWIIDLGLLSKAEIIKNLQFKVDYNGKKKENYNAKKKWQEDILFVSKYIKGNVDEINAIFIEY